MYKVLRIINRFNLGGPTYNVAYLSKYLEPDFQTILVGGEKDESEDSSLHILDELGLKPIIIPEMKREINWKNDQIAYKKIRELIKLHKPDIVHTHASKAGTLGRLAASAEKVPVIIHTFHGHVFHSYFGKLKTGFYKNIERYLAGKSTKIIAISDLQKNELSTIHKICKPEKIEVIPLGFSLDKFSENIERKREQFRLSWKIKNDELAIGIIGRLVPIKNHKLFFDAVSSLKNSNKIKFKAVVIGDGELRIELEDYAKNLGLKITGHKDVNEHVDVIFTSWIKEVDIALAGLDMVALTSLNEGTPVSLIEAQAAQKPIVSTNVGGIEEVVIPNKTCLLNPIDKPSDFIANFIKLAENEILRNEMSVLGRSHVIEKYHYNRLTRDMRNLYFDLLNANK